MRDIKFRAWDELDNNMIYQDYLSASEILNRFDCIMQYTGLKDKEGKEIYEGDIVKFKTMIGSEQIGVVVFHQGEYCAEIKRKNHSSYYRLYEFYKDNENIKIVGNKYENPELKGGE